MDARNRAPIPVGPSTRSISVPMLACLLMLAPPGILPPTPHLSGQPPQIVRPAAHRSPDLEPEATAPATLARPPLDIDVAPEGFLYRVVRSDGRVYYASIVSGGDPVRLGLPPGGVEELPRAGIIRIEQVRGAIVNGDFWPQDPNHSRLIFAPTGRNLPRRSGSVNAYYGVMPFLAVGITDWFTVAGGASLVKSDGFELFPTSTAMVPSEEEGASPGRTVHLAPKVQLLRTRRLEAAVGALVFLRTGDPSIPTGMGYAVGTWAFDDQTGMTAGAGLGLIQSRWDATPAWLVGADHRMSRRVKLLTENYRFPGGETVHMAGVRLLGEQLSADIALAAHPGADSRRVFPVLNVSFGW